VASVVPAALMTADDGTGGPLRNLIESIVGAAQHKAAAMGERLHATAELATGQTVAAVAASAAALAGGGTAIDELSDHRHPARAAQSEELVREPAAEEPPEPAPPALPPPTAPEEQPAAAPDSAPAPGPQPEPVPPPPDPRTSSTPPARRARLRRLHPRGSRRPASVRPAAERAAPPVERALSSPRDQASRPSAGPRVAGAGVRPGLRQPRGVSVRCRSVCESR
jgi:protein TonB